MAQWSTQFLRIKATIIAFATMYTNEFGFSKSCYEFKLS